MSNTIREDTISRQAVIEQIYNWSTDELLRYTNPFDYLCKRINSLPSVTPQSKIGHWIKWYEKVERKTCTEYIPHCKCSECNKEYNAYTSLFIKYCSQCGAKMEGE